ncbi:hypothetical protein [Dechloromonas sp. HYN0024]|uniref:hypothetical protein n=1 Tax=Dechloromonas sp. HYN0024 TaxID=2231055 RepID=UPI000E4314C0|nr:hypothetical protein [Dechloromonas sp. HYN0024]AXS80656.1 hypothetical protein HYN24_11875 [Dechloromonas sp. HYN0024]
MRRWYFALLLLLSGAVLADESVRVCYGYSCVAQADIRFTEGQLGEVRRILSAAEDAESERGRLAEVIGRLYAWAGEQSYIHNDRGGNYADGHMPGKMDCIDHSTSTTRLLKMLEARHYLRWHGVLAPVERGFAKMLFVHWSALIEEKAAGEAGRFVVDSWFVDNGQPAVILPLGEWMKGAGPDV